MKSYKCDKPQSNTQTDSGPPIFFIAKKHFNGATRITFKSLKVRLCHPPSSILLRGLCPFSHIYSAGLLSPLLPLPRSLEYGPTFYLKPPTQLYYFPILQKWSQPFQNVIFLGLLVFQLNYRIVFCHMSSLTFAPRSDCQEWEKKIKPNRSFVHLRDEEDLCRQ